MTLSEHIAAAGGLVTASGMARRWNISTGRANQLVKHSTFPESVAEADGLKLWAWNEVNEWREDRKAMYGTAETPA